MTMTNVGALPVSTLAADVVARVPEDANLWEVAEGLVDADVGALAVVDDDDEVQGVVSERDLVRALAARRDPSTTTARAVAHTRLVWCDVNSVVAEVAEQMMDRYVRHVLVEEDGRVVGIVSARDLLGAYAAAETFADEEQP
jgi:signal-transduction protein with cAMP-binding, CBS, and nucleotidyltransferase domain